MTDTSTLAPLTDETENSFLKPIFFKLLVQIQFNNQHICLPSRKNMDYIT